jgi:hypothetical protein
MSEKDVDSMIAVAWSQVFYACEREVAAKVAGDKAFSLRWSAMRERATEFANQLEDAKLRPKRHAE